MRNLALFTALILSCLIHKLYAQETFESKTALLADRIEQIHKSEKEALKKELEQINQDIEQQKINVTDAEIKKKHLAETHAKNIENQMDTIQIELAELINQKANGKLNSNRVKINDQYTLSWPKEKDSIKKNNGGESRTTTQLVLAGGVNNAFVNQHFAHSDFRYWGSHFYELGITLNTRLSKTSNLLHLKYGLTFQYNNLRATDNRYFQETNNETYLVKNTDHALQESRFRNVYMTFPIHLEFDWTKVETKDGKAVFRTHRSFRAGIGGYVGVNLDTKQFIEYDTPTGYNETIQHNDFNTQNFIYGLSAYVGHKSTSLYVKYDLNALFTSNSFNYHQASLGIRYDFN